MATLIASLLREQRQAEDRAMFDAWQNGGMYQGKPVTDDRLLGYIKMRRDGFSKDDPVWAEWDNRLTQYGFSIGESKVQLAFKQGKVGADDVAAFYRNALEKVPKDSEFYRDVASRATQWAGAAAGAARSRARGRASSGTRSKLNKQLEKQQDYLALEAALTAYAKREGLISGNQVLADADASELTDMFGRGIYDGETQITLDSFQKAAEGHLGALNAEIETRLSLGQQAVEARNKRDRFLEGTVVRLAVVDERVQYETARQAWIDNVNAAQGNPWLERSANEAYLRTLGRIHGNASSPLDGRQNDPEFIGGLVNEFDAISTGKAKGKTVADLWDMEDAAGSGEDVAEYAAQLQTDLDDIDSGRAYFGQSEAGGPMEVVRWPQGGPSALGLDDSLQPSVTSVNGERRIVYLKGQPVTASVILDEAGQQVDPADPSVRENVLNGTYTIESSGTAGYVFTNPVDGTTRYGVRDAQGNLVFTKTNPWASDPTNAGSGLTVFGGEQRQLANGDYVVVPNSILKPDTMPSLMAGFDPILSDSMVSPKELMAFAEQGVKGFAPEDIAAYQQRLQNQEQERVTRLSNRDLGMTDISRVGEDRSVGISDPRDAGIVAQLSATSNILRSSFMRNASKDDTYAPPPPPTLAATPVKAPAPIAKPKPVTDDSPIAARLRDPFYEFSTKPKSAPDPTAPVDASGVGAGTYGALNRYKQKQLTIGSGKLGSGGR